MQDQSMRLIVDMGPSATNIGEAEQKLERLKVAAQGASQSSSQLSQRILNLGRAAQDLAQGGFGGIINNIEGIIGGGGIAAGVLTAIGTAAYLAAPKIKAWADEMAGGKDKIPETTDRLKLLTEQIKANKDAIDELTKKQQLDYFEMERRNRLLDETAKKEEELANARAARQVGAYASKADQARAQAFRAALGEFGGGEKLIEELMTKGGRTQARAEEMISEAQKGNVNEIRNILNRTQGFGQFYTSPEEQAQRKAREDVQKRIQQDIEAKNRGLQQAAEAEARGPAEAERNKEKAEREREAGLKKHAADLERRTQRELREADRERADAAKEAKGQLETTAGQLMAQGPAIVGEAFGPQAAQAAAQANPAEVHAMRARTIQNLEQGQLPYDAVLDAFREVYEQSQRNRARGQAFGAQMRGMQGRFQQGGQSAMDK